VSWGALLVRALEALPAAVAALPKLPGAVRDAWRGRRPHAAPGPAAGELPHVHAEHIRRHTHGHMVTEGTRSYWCAGPDWPDPCARCRASRLGSPRAVTHDASGAPRRRR
jgi:hypothetical protein